MKLKSWREVARPHKDVLEGSLLQSEFAADISAVANGESKPMYQDPVQFYARTFLTDGMRLLLTSVAKRLNAKGGEPVIELQTSFGGGKTHTLVAVYHLASRPGSARDLPGVAGLLDAAGLDDVPNAKVAVVDGAALSPNEPFKIDGLEIRTVAGLVAYRLAGKAGYAKFAASDAVGTAPGKALISELLNEVGPCVILMDELVMYYRQFGVDGDVKLTGGTYGANISFVQALTEAVKLAPQAVLLASLPSSDTEAAGAFGAQVLKTLEKTFDRVNSIWRTTSSEEGFEIVKRRLFEPMTDNAAVEETCTAFGAYYHENRPAFPKDVQDGAWKDRMRRCYPFHPEVFARLYEDWSTMEKFQKTRGVLQLLAVVLRALWECGDEDPLIMPASLPLGDAKTETKCLTPLPNGWKPIIDAEIDGATASATMIDAKNVASFGKLGAAVRVARTIFLGTAPESAPECGATHVVRGIDISRILFGCALPDQQLSFYKDALAKLRDEQHYLFNDDDRYWYDTRPTLKRTMEAYREKITAVESTQGHVASIQRVWGAPSVFATKHVFAVNKEVPDDITNGLRLVVLPLNCAYVKSDPSHAFNAAQSILAWHGAMARLRRNRLVFLAADLNAVGRMQDDCDTFLAWQAVASAIKGGVINATKKDESLVNAQVAQAQKMLDGAISMGFKFVLVPVPDGPNKTTFAVRTLKASVGGRLGEAVEKTLLDQEDVVRDWAPKFLRKILDENYFKNGHADVSLNKVWTDMAAYCCFPRLMSLDVFLRTVEKGVAEKAFGLAKGKEAEAYRDLKFGESLVLCASTDQDFLVQACAAESQKKAEATPAAKDGLDDGGSGSPKGVINVPRGGLGKGDAPGDGKKAEPPVIPPVVNRKFAGTVSFDLSKGLAPLKEVMDEVLSHFGGAGVTLKVNLEVTAKSVNPFPPKVVKVVSENAATLKFSHADFT